MNFRYIPITVLMCGFLAVICCFARFGPIPLNHGKNKSSVKLSLKKVTTKQLEEKRGLFFMCEVEIENNFGSELIVKSPFQSAFDGFEIVVFDSSGHKLLQEPYWNHQTYYSPKQEFRLKKGKNLKTLAFDVSELPSNLQKFTVLVTGSLPGSVHKSPLYSNLVKVSIK